MAQYYLLDVFTESAYGGNPLAVFPDASGIPEQLFQTIAREFNLSETVFVLPNSDGDGVPRLRIFTPAAELPFAGHPTVGTASLLSELKPEIGEEFILREEVGEISISIQTEQSGLRSARFRLQAEPVVESPEIEPAALAGVLSLSEENMSYGSAKPFSVSCGVPFLFCPLSSLEALQSAILDHAEWLIHISKLSAPHLYLYFQEEPSLIHARMFAPGLGILEDPATGAAATAYGAYHAADKIGESFHFTILQGETMGRPSRIVGSAKRPVEGTPVEVEIGGNSVIIAEGSLRETALRG